MELGEGHGIRADFREIPGPHDLLNRGAEDVAEAKKLMQ